VGRSQPEQIGATQVGKEYIPRRRRFELQPVQVLEIFVDARSISGERRPRRGANGGTAGYVASSLARE
jgi:hypothetical protein